MNASEVYLDWNATAPTHPAVLEAMREAAGSAWGNPSSVHAAGRRARAIVESAREAIGAALGFDARDVVFTSGGTESNNLALRGVAGLAVSRIEHPSVVRAAEALHDGGVPVEWLPVPESGRIEPGSIRQALERLPSGAWVSLAAANHETGVVQPITEVAEIAHEMGARLHVDAVQALGKLPSRAWRGADRISVASHKIRGPKGIGALGWSVGSAPVPVLVGGEQERGLRPGTLDAVAAAGFRVAVERVEESTRRHPELAALRDRFEAAFADRAVVNGAGAPRLAHVCNASFGGARGDELVAALDLVGVRVSSGSACSAGTTEPSKVIEAMLGRARAIAAVRVSLGEDTSEGDIDHAIAAFNRALANIERRV
jgi:cysteine desulfurase